MTILLGVGVKMAGITGLERKKYNDLAVRGVIGNGLSIREAL
jgi:hypothetical protein